MWSLGISLVELAQGRFPFADPPESGEESEEEYDPDPTLPVSAQRPNIPSEKRHRKRGVSLGGGGMTMSILDLLQHIVNEPAPRLSTAKKTFPAAAEDFIDGCLDKDPMLRRSPQELLVSLFFYPPPWISRIRSRWARRCRKKIQCVGSVLGYSDCWIPDVVTASRNVHGSLHNARPRTG